MSEFVAKGVLNKKEKKFKGLSEISFISKFLAHDNDFPAF